MANKWNVKIKMSVDLTKNFSVIKEGETISLFGSDPNDKYAGWDEELKPGDQGYDFFNQLFKERNDQ